MNGCPKLCMKFIGPTNSCSAMYTNIRRPHEWSLQSVYEYLSARRMVAWKYEHLYVAPTNGCSEVRTCTLGQMNSRYSSAKTNEYSSMYSHVSGLRKVGQIWPGRSQLLTFDNVGCCFVIRGWGPCKGCGRQCCGPCNSNKRHSAAARKSQCLSGSSLSRTRCDTRVRGD